jgi:hypothetical protein
MLQNYDIANEEGYDKGLIRPFDFFIPVGGRLQHIKVPSINLPHPDGPQENDPVGTFAVSIARENSNNT